MESQADRLLLDSKTGKLLRLMKRESWLRLQKMNLTKMYRVNRDKVRGKMGL